MKKYYSEMFIGFLKDKGVYDKFMAAFSDWRNLTDTAAINKAFERYLDQRRSIDYIRGAFLWSEYEFDLWDRINAKWLEKSELDLWLVRDHNDNLILYTVNPQLVSKEEKDNLGICLPVTDRFPDVTVENSPVKARLTID